MFHSMQETHNEVAQNDGCVCLIRAEAAVPFFGLKIGVSLPIKWIQRISR